MYAKRIRTKSMTKDQLENAEKEIIQIYLYLISRTKFDPRVIEVKKLSAWSDVHGRFKSGELDNCGSIKAEQLSCCLYSLSKVGGKAALTLPPLLKIRRSNHKG